MALDINVVKENMMKKINITVTKTLTLVILLSISSITLAKPPFVLISSGGIDIPIKLPEVEEVVSVNNAGELSKHHDYNPLDSYFGLRNRNLTISNNGRYVAFNTNATNLDPERATFQYTSPRNIAVRDRWQDRTFYVNQNPDGSFDDVRDSFAFSADSESLLYAVNGGFSFDTGSENNRIIMHNLLTGSSSVAHKRSTPRNIFINDNDQDMIYDGGNNLFYSYNIKTEVETKERVVWLDGFTYVELKGKIKSVSADGRYVLYVRDTFNINRGQLHNGLWIWDREKDIVNNLIDIQFGFADNVQPPQNFSSPRISADGSTVVFSSYETGLIDGAAYLYLYDVTTQKTTRILDRFGNAALAEDTDIDASGQLVSYVNSEGQHYVYSTKTKVHKLIATGISPIDESGRVAELSRDGRYLVFIDNDRQVRVTPIPKF